MEIWKDIEDYEGHYQVSNIGRVKSLLRKSRNRFGEFMIKEKNLTLVDSGNGYLGVCLSKKGIFKSRLIHQLVAESFLGHARCGMKLVINHINFDRKDNRVENLEIVSSRENSNRKHLKSTSKYTGVSWKTKDKKYVAQIRIMGKVSYLGLFENEIDAHNTYQNALKDVLKMEASNE